MTEQFRDIDPLTSDALYTDITGDRARICLVAPSLTVPEARALRDWLNRALPEESTVGANG